MKRAVERTEWESKTSGPNVAHELKAAAMDLVLARKALLMVRRDELKKLLESERVMYVTELAQRGLSLTKHRL
jgi:hypothetical protein